MFSPKLRAFSVLLATLRPPTCSNPAEIAAPATAVAWSAYLPSSRALIIFSSVTSILSLINPCSMAPI